MPGALSPASAAGQREAAAGLHRVGAVRGEPAGRTADGGPDAQSGGHATHRTRSPVGAPASDLGGINVADRRAAPRSGLAVVAVTRPGAALAARVAAALPDARPVGPVRFAAAAGVEGYEGPVAPLVARLFAACEGLVLIMAVGAAVRLIAPHLRHKAVDPAVVVVDDAGRYAIPVLAGHTGGANALARRVAAALGAEPVITTASEAHGLPAADMLGREFGWRVENPQELKALAAALVNGDPVGLAQEAGEPVFGAAPRPATVTVFPDIAALLDASPSSAIIVSDRLLPAAVRRPGWVVYRPRTLVLGIGCSRGATAADIAALVDAALAGAGLAAASIREVASIDLKADETGLLAFAAERALPLRLFSAAQLDATPGQQTRSSVVRAAVGTGGVCEPAALLAAGTAELLVPKRKSATVTVAVARAPLGRAGAAAGGGARRTAGWNDGHVSE